MINFELEAVGGDTIELLAEIVREGSPVNITGASFVFTARKDKYKAPYEFRLVGSDITIIDAAGGKALVTIDPSYTSDYTGVQILYCDLEMTENNGRVTTVAHGNLKIQLG